MSSAYDGLRVELRDGALWLTIDNPDTFNALTGEMVLGLTAELRKVVSRDEVRSVVLTGSGAAFCTGADLTGWRSLDERAVEAANQLVRAVVACDRPVVCGLNGVAAGVGMALALACDLVVATASASLTLGFSRIGLMPDGGSTATVAAAVGRARAMRLALLSEVLPAQEAYDAGLVSHVVPDEEWATTLDKLVARLVAGPPLALAATKKAINAATLDQFKPALDREYAGQPVLLRTADFAEGVEAFLGKRRARFTGA
ncbi:MAG TPA: enoyl-CoA hydratase-related protein [Marmoricola sp.]|nr:enoyl-CoA hydratase-related protein [Marmoricola sp.]